MDCHLLPQLCDRGLQLHYLLAALIHLPRAPRELLRAFAGFPAAHAELTLQLADLAACCGQRAVAGRQLRLSAAAQVCQTQCQRQAGSASLEMAPPGHAQLVSSREAAEDGINCLQDEVHCLRAQDSMMQDACMGIICSVIGCRDEAWSPEGTRHGSG